MLLRERRKPFPKLDSPDSQANDLGHLNAALAAFMLAANAEEIAGANQLLLDFLVRQPGQHRLKSGTQAHAPELPADTDWFHFAEAQYLFRIERMFGPSGTTGRGRLTPANRELIAKAFYDWASIECLDAGPRRMRSWDVWGSENHGAQHDATCWAAAMLLSEMPAWAPRPYADGSTAERQLQDWTAFLRQYLADRATHGTFVEYFSPTYAQYTLTNIYLYADFAKDPELKRLAGLTLDLWWALWAQEQLDGVHGGSQTRRYAQSLATGTPMPATAWLYFGMGPVPANLPPGEAAAYASTYRPPAVIADIATDAAGRGSYTAFTRAPGLAARPTEDGPIYHVDSARNAILRVADATPDYVMGMGMLRLLPAHEWTAMSAQNRWSGIIVAGGDPAARITPTVVAAGGEKLYNALFGVQHRGLQLVRPTLSALAKPGNRMQVWFGTPLKRTEANGWVFVDSGAYIAIRPATGGWHWLPGDPHWMVPDQPDTPIIIQAAARHDFADIAAFIAAVTKLPIRLQPDRLDVTGLGSAGRLSLGLGENGLMQIDGRDVNLEPAYVFDSPFVKESQGSAVVHIQKGGRSLSLDFTPK